MDILANKGVTLEEVKDAIDTLNEDYKRTPEYELLSNKEKAIRSVATCTLGIAAAAHVHEPQIPPERVIEYLATLSNFAFAGLGIHGEDAARRLGEMEKEMLEITKRAINLARTRKGLKEEQ